METGFYQVQATIIVTKVQVERGGQEQPIQATRIEGLGKGRTQKEAYEAMLRNGVETELGKLNGVEVISGPVVVE